MLIVKNPTYRACRGKSGSLQPPIKFVFFITGSRPAPALFSQYIGVSKLPKI